MSGIETSGPGESGLAELRRALATVAVVPVTPFREDGTPDLDAFGVICGRILDAGVTVLTPNGNTGEFCALTEPETRRMLTATTGLARGRALVMAGVGHDLATAIAAARHARENGAELIMVHQPAGPYLSGEGWIEYHARIAAAVPELGVVLYLRSTAITGADIAALADRAPNVAGVKYAVRDAAGFARVARDADPGLSRLTWLAGAAELTAPMFWAAGARGFTSGLANVAPVLALDMFQALDDNDFPASMRVWETVRRFEELRLANGSADNVAVVKEALAQLGLCRAEARPPSRPLPAPVRAEIGQILKSWGLGG